MKKASIIFSIVGLLFLGSTYYFMQKSTHLISESEQAALDIEILMHSNKTALATKFLIPDNEDEYYYEDMELKQEEHIAINNCMQFYMNKESFDNADKCEEIIVDTIIENMGEVAFIKAVVGIMINYKSEVSIKDNFPKMFFDTGTTEAPLKSKLILIFLNRYRSPVKLQVAFDNYKDYFFDNTSENLYKKLFKDYTDTFIGTYEEINGMKDKEYFFQNIYYEAETKNRHSEFWNFTFWKRRELEKNDKTIYAILKEIQNHYER